MFERYTEPARRSIFFARYEASIFGSPYIETEHLLLGILREGKVLTEHLSIDARDEIRKRVEERSERREKIATSADLPISTECKRVLAYGAEESSKMGHRVIDVGHLVLGVLRTESSLAAQLLRQHGIDLHSFRDVVLSSEPYTPPAVGEVWMRPVEKQREFEQVDAPEAAAPSLRTTVTSLRHLVERMLKSLDPNSEAYGFVRLKRKPWLRKQALGHLVDYAAAHHTWFTLTVAEGRLVVGAYPQDEWVALERYQDCDWSDIVDAWISLNRVLIHTLSQIPEEKVTAPCRIGLAEPIPLARLVEDYVNHCEDLAAQILSRLG